MSEYQKHIIAWHFDFTRAKVGKPVISLSEIYVSVEQFGILKGVLGIEISTFFSSAVLVYEDVIESKRMFRKYADSSGNSFGDEEIITDGPFEPSKKPMFYFSIHAVSKNPFAWLSWEIVAASVRVEDKIPFIDSRT